MSSYSVTNNEVAEFAAELHYLSQRALCKEGLRCLTFLDEAHYANELLLARLRLQHSLAEQLLSAVDESQQAKLLAILLQAAMVSLNKHHNYFGAELIDDLLTYHPAVCTLLALNEKLSVEDRQLYYDLQQALHITTETQQHFWQDLHQQQALPAIKFCALKFAALKNNDTLSRRFQQLVAIPLLRLIEVLHGHVDLNNTAIDLVNTLCEQFLLAGLEAYWQQLQFLQQDGQKQTDADSQNIQKRREALLHYWQQFRNSSESYKKEKQNAQLGQELRHHATELLLYGLHASVDQAEAWQLLASSYGTWRRNFQKRANQKTTPDLYAQSSLSEQQVLAQWAMQQPLATLVLAKNKAISEFSQQALLKNLTPERDGAQAYALLEKVRLLQQQLGIKQAQLFADCQEKLRGFLADYAPTAFEKGKQQLRQQKKQLSQEGPITEKQLKRREKVILDTSDEQQVLLIAAKSYVMQLMQVDKKLITELEKGSVWQTGLFTKVSREDIYAVFATTEQAFQQLIFSFYYQFLQQLEQQLTADLDKHLLVDLKKANPQLAEQLLAARKAAADGKIFDEKIRLKAIQRLDLFASKEQQQCYQQHNYIPRLLIHCLYSGYSSKLLANAQRRGLLLLEDKLYALGGLKIMPIADMAVVTVAVASEQLQAEKIEQVLMTNKIPAAALMQAILGRLLLSSGFKEGKPAAAAMSALQTAISLTIALLKDNSESGYLKELLTQCLRLGWQKTSMVDMCYQQQDFQQQALSFAAIRTTVLEIVNELYRENEKTAPEPAATVPISTFARKKLTDSNKAGVKVDLSEYTENVVENCLIDWLAHSKSMGFFAQQQSRQITDGLKELLSIEAKEENTAERMQLLNNIINPLVKMKVEDNCKIPVNVTASIINRLESLAAEIRTQPNELQQVIAKLYITSQRRLARNLDLHSDERAMHYMEQLSEFNTVLEKSRPSNEQLYVTLQQLLLESEYAKLLNLMDEEHYQQLRTLYQTIKESVS